MRGSSIGWKERAGAGPSWSAPPSTSATGWIRSNPRRGFGRLFTATDLTVYPEPYRYMAARLVAAGRALAPVVYSDGSPHTAQLYARYEDWLAQHA